MGIFDRTLAAARSLLAAEQPSAQQVVDAVTDPNSLTRSRGMLGDLWYNTSALYNTITGAGTNRDPSYYNQWAVPRPLLRSELYGMGRNALILQALSKLPNTATREGWRVKITDTDIAEPGAYSDQIAAYEQRIGLAAACARSMLRGRQYGGSIVLLGIDDGRSFAEPVNLATVRTVRWAAVIDTRSYDPASLYPPASEHFGQVEKFRITDINGVLEDGLRYGSNSLTFTATQLDEEKQRQGGELLVHADRVLHFPTADYLPVLDTLQDSLGAFFESMSGIRTAARESSTVVYKVSNWLRKMWSENAGLAKMQMALQDRAKSNLNAWVVDKENEEVEIKSRSLGGVAQLADPFMVWLAASLAIPVTVLWGVSPGGFGKGEAERETWHEEVRAFQQNVLAPQLHKAHDYMLVAADGCGLPADTQREILFNDLSPPDEDLRAEMRSAALSDIRALSKDGVISRTEARSGVAALQDDYFRVDLETDIKEAPAPAPVGIVTGGVALLKAMYPAGIPLESGQNFLLAVDPEHFTAENIASIFPEQASTGSASALPSPTDEEDAEGNEESAPEESIWSDDPLPSDAEEARVIAEKLGVPTVRVTRAHRAGLIEGWTILGGKPRYSLAEVHELILRSNGKLPEVSTTDAADAAPLHSMVVVLRAPEHVAQWVPYKSQDISAPHVTALHIGKVQASDVPEIVSAVASVVHSMAPCEVTLTGLDYFDNDEQRVAFASVEPSAALKALHTRLVDAVLDIGLEPKHHGGDYTPHLTLAYLQPGSEYTGPCPAEGQGWTAVDVELWCGDFVIPFAFDAEAEPVRDPFRNEHAARQRAPGDFIANTLRRKEITEGISIIVGKLKSNPEGPMTIQTYRFASSKFTAEQARAWLKDHAIEHTAVEEAKPERDRAPLIKEGWIWRTQKDRRVRPAHRKLEGKRFRPGEKHPTEGAPGDQPNCRCAKETIVPPSGTQEQRRAARRDVRRDLRKRYKAVTKKALRSKKKK